MPLAGRNTGLDDVGGQGIGPRFHPRQRAGPRFYRKTAMTAKLWPEIRQKRLDGIALGRMGTPCKMWPMSPCFWPAICPAMCRVR